MIKIQNVSKSYKKGNKVVENLNLEIKDGEIFGFIGQNGAGKTTTIKMITGILEIDEGDIFIDGKSITKEPEEAKKQFGLVPDSPDMFLKFSGIEYLNFIADCFNVNQEDRKKRIEKLSKEFGIYDELENKIESYSHGMRQKIVIIGVLLHNPKNWILDEPITGLDPKSSFDLKSLMKEHAKKGNTVFFSTHILEIAEKLCDRIAIINKGKIVFVGTLNELKNMHKDKNTLEEIFIDIIK
ncbi:MAG: ABC transporter ATP-binding protein [Clostridia bacterium]|nr:ABC transporter ATP-binding protein [Clostridia bacterium]